MAKNIVERRAKSKWLMGHQKCLALVIAGKCRLKLWDNGIQSGWQEKSRNAFAVRNKEWT